MIRDILYHRFTWFPWEFCITNSHSFLGNRSIQSSENCFTPAKVSTRQLSVFLVEAVVAGELTAVLVGVAGVLAENSACNGSRYVALPRQR